MFESFYGNEAQQYAYYSVPQLLFTDDKFKNLSCECKLLYAFLLDRAGLSVKNNWLDDDGKVYVYFTRDELCDKLNIGKDKATRVFNELENKIGLIKRKRQGQGKPTKIFVNNFTKFSEDGKEKIQKAENQTSGKPENENAVKTAENQTSVGRKNSLLKGEKSDLSLYINPNISILTESSLSNQSKSESETDLRTDLLNDKIDMIDFKSEKEKVSKMISAESIFENKPLVDELIDLIAWASLTPCKYIRINGINLDSNLVKEQFSKLRKKHIEYVIECLNSSKSMPKKRRSYLLTCLYNAPSTIDSYYEASKKTVKENNETSYNLSEFEKYAMDFSLYDNDDKQEEIQ